MENLPLLNQPTIFISKNTCPWQLPLMDTGWWLVTCKQVLEVTLRRAIQPASIHLWKMEETGGFLSHGDTLKSSISRWDFP